VDQGCADQEAVQKRFLKGKKRLETVSEMKASGTTAKSMYYSKLSTMTDEEIKSGNITTCQTPQVVRQLTYENAVKKRLAFDVIEELVIQKESWDIVLKGQLIKGFVQCIGYCPFLLLSTRKIRLGFLSTVATRKKIQIHFTLTVQVQ
jgi:hypothetical protein